jgi:hypothetical protein
MLWWLRNNSVCRFLRSLASSFNSTFVEIDEDKVWIYHDFQDCQMLDSSYLHPPEMSCRPPYIDKQRILRETPGFSCQLHLAG